MWSPPTLFDNPEQIRLDTYHGRLVHKQEPPLTKAIIAARITGMDLDVLCVQGSRNIDALGSIVAQRLQCPDNLG